MTLYTQVNGSVCNATFKIDAEYGYDLAIKYLGFNKSLERKGKVVSSLTTLKLAKSTGDHSKFLRFITVYLDIKASRHFWQEFSTYHFLEQNSESTMHTLLEKPLTQDDFVREVNPLQLIYVNQLINEGDLIKAKDNLPEGFLQRRGVVTNYETLKTMIKQRSNHKNPEWKLFVKELLDNLQHGYLITET